MTQTRDKLRSLFLTVLLVVSAVGTTVAFSGAAAAANSESITINPNKNSGTTDATYTLSAVVESGGTVEEIVVDLDDGADPSNVGTSDVSVDFDGSSVSVADVSVSGTTVTIDVSDSITSGDSVTVEIDDVTNDESGSHTASVDLQDSGGSTIDDFSVGYSIIGSSDRVRFGEADAPWYSNGGPFWQGQKLFLKNADDPNAQYQLREADDGDTGSFISDISLDSNGEAIIDTGNVGGQELDGEYVVLKNSQPVEFGSDGKAVQVGADVSDASLEIAPQSFSAEFEEETVRTDLAEITFNSNRAGYDLLVSADSLDEDELRQIFTNFTIVDNPEEDDDQITIRVTNTADTRDLDVSNVESGDYTFEFEVNDTTGSDDATISISQPEDAEASFLDGGVYQVTQGGIVEIPIELKNTDVAKINLGYDGQVYNETVEVKDDDDDDRVTLRVNTYLAGRKTLAEGDPTDLDDGASGKDDIAKAYSLADDDDEILSVSRLGDGIGSPPLAPTLYDLNVSVGDEELAVGAMDIREPGDEKLLSWTAPERVFREVDDREEFFEAKGDDLFTVDSKIAKGDTLVYQIQSSSLVGALEAETDGDDYGEGLATLVDDNDDVVPADAFTFRMEQKDPDANRDPKKLDIQDTANGGGLKVIPDSGNSSVYLIFDTDKIRMERDFDNDNDLSIGTERYETNYTIGPESGIPDDDEKITVIDEFEIVERTLEFDTTNDRIEVRAEADQLVSGETSVAAGTEIRLRLRGINQNNPVFKTPTVTVSKGGNFSALIDFSDEAANTSFDADATGFEGSTPGIILAPRTASIEFDDQSTFGTQVTVDSVTTSDGGFVAIHRGSPTGDVIGTSEYVANGTVEDLQISVNADLADGETVYAVPHYDENDDGEFSYGIDPAYRANGSTVSASASLTIRTPTPTTTAPPTTAPPTTSEPPTTSRITANTTSAPEDDDEETTTTGPGFTVGLGLLALLGAALLAARRDE